MQRTLLFIVTIAVLLLGLQNLNAQALDKNNKPFLILGKLPHYVMILKKKWDDPKLALTQEQKKALLRVRKETLTKVKLLAPQIKHLEQSIVQATKEGKNPQTLEEKIDELARLRAEATKVHLRCIYRTQKILTPRQMRMISRH